MRALVTGSNGFVGRHLTMHLERSGDDVVGVDRDEGDVTDAEAMLRVMEDVRPEVVFHLAALTHVGESWNNASEYTRVNVVGTQRVLDAAYDVVPEAVTVVISSADVYGIVDESALPLTESQRVAPANPYSSSKVEAEHVALEATRLRDQRVIIARPFNHLGPGQATSFVVPALASRLLDAAEAGEGTIAVGDLSPRRDFSDVRDVVRAYRLLASGGVSGEVYNVATGRDVAIGDVASQMAELLALEVTFVQDATLLRPVELPVLRGDHQKLTRATDWAPVIALSDSLRDVIDDLRIRRGGTP